MDNTRSCSRHLGGYSPFTLQLRLVPLKGLLPTILELEAVVVLGEAMLQRYETYDNQKADR